jgi:uncharacterized membrane protein YtjA (UPF0391 family)
MFLVCFFGSEVRSALGPECGELQIQHTSRVTQAGNGAERQALVGRWRHDGADGENPMLGWALTFLVVALIAGVLGFTTIAGAAIGIAKIVFYVFLVLFVVSLIMNFVRGRGTTL